MPKAMTRIVSVCTVISFFTGVACGGAIAPNNELANAKSALSAAKAADAASVPEGALHLKLSDDAVHSAEAQMQNGENDKATMTLGQAKADADLALLLARENQARQELRQFEGRAAHDQDQ
jgi:Domain of unknown function (DUF4398)